jgi:hypothetical protein
MLKMIALLFVCAAFGCTAQPQAAPTSIPTPDPVMDGYQFAVYQVLLANPEGLRPFEIRRAVEDYLGQRLGDNIGFSNEFVRLQERGLIERIEIGDTDVIYRVIPQNP